MSQETSAEKVVQEIRRKTRRWFSAEEKIRVVLEPERTRQALPGRHELGRAAQPVPRREGC